MVRLQQAEAAAGCAILGRIRVTTHAYELVRIT